VEVLFIWEEKEKQKMTPQKILTKNFKEKHYICPNCGKLSTESQLVEDASEGGLPYCYCKFTEGRIFIGYKRINKKLWQELKELKTDKLRLKNYIKYKVEKRNKK